MRPMLKGVARADVSKVTVRRVRSVDMLGDADGLLGEDLGMRDGLTSLINELGDLQNYPGNNIHSPRGRYSEATYSHERNDQSRRKLCTLPNID